MDGSDESIDYCNVRTCPTNYFMCNSRRCIPLNQTCDGIEQCGDGSDETICHCNSTEHFKCKSGQCIDKTYRCDSGIFHFTLNIEFFTLNFISSFENLNLF